MYPSALTKQKGILFHVLCRCKNFSYCFNSDVVVLLILLAPFRSESGLAAPAAVACDSCERKRKAVIIVAVVASVASRLTTPACQPKWQSSLVAEANGLANHTKEKGVLRCKRVIRNHSGVGSEAQPNGRIIYVNT